MASEVVGGEEEEEEENQERRRRGGKEGWGHGGGCGGSWTSLAPSTGFHPWFLPVHVQLTLYEFLKFFFLRSVNLRLISCFGWGKKNYEKNCLGL